MKNERLFRVLGIAVLAVIMLTWFIPSSTYDGYDVTLGAISPVGIWDFFNAIGIATAYFWQPGLIILFIGGLYGIVNKTGSLKVLVDNIKTKFKSKEKWFLVISIVFFMVTSSLTGIYLSLFAFVPLFIAVIISMGYNKLTALLCTVGAIIIGNMSLMYNNVIYQTLYIEPFVNLWYKVPLFLLTLAITIFYVWKTAYIKRGRKAIDNSMLFLEEGPDNNKEIKKWPLITAFTALFVVTVLGITPWYNMFGMEFFNNIYESIMGVSIGNFQIFQNLLGQSLLPFGQWGMVELFTVIALASLFVAIAYKLPLNEMIQGFVSGANRLLTTAIILIAINVVVVFTLNAGFYTTILNFLVNLTESFNLFTMSINMLFGSMLIVDNLYLANYVINTTANVVNYEASMPLLALTGQAMYGTAMLIAPTSLVLLAGLSYTGVPYQDWMKYIWRLLLMLIAITTIILIITTLL